EVEAPCPVLPHRRRRPIVVADEHNRVDRLEPPCEQSEEPETHRRVDASAILIRDNPSENAAETQHPIGLGRDLLHLLIETRFAAQPAGVTPLNDASPASGWPADWEGKSHVV